MLPHNTEKTTKEWAEERILKIEDHVDSDVLTFIGPIQSGTENIFRMVIEGLDDKRDSLLVILDTPGGIVETVERIVHVLRQHYGDVDFLVPDRAMSAGTILAMSGDRILMDYHSCLGPIDPQVEKDGRLIPALSYLVQYERLVEKAEEGTLTTTDLTMLQKLDLAELHKFELARDLSIKLLQDWLANYKFKDWTETETRGKEVDQEMREQRAAEIAEALNDHERWHTHSRGIGMETLQKDLQLKIDDYSADAELQDLVWNYFWFLKDHMGNKEYPSFIHTREFF